MEEVKFTVKALAAIKEVTIEELADMAGISVNHLKKVSSGAVKMTADDLINLSRVTGIPPENIRY